MRGEILISLQQQQEEEEEEEEEWLGLAPGYGDQLRPVWSVMTTQ